MPSYKPVIALTRGLEVLRVVNELGDAQVKDIHERTGLDKATIVRMLETLIHEGYVSINTAGQGYKVDGRVLVLSQGFDRHRIMAEAAAPILATFRQSIGWPSDMAICDRDAMILVRTTREPGPLSFNRRAGFRASIPETSLGKAYLAFCGGDEKTKILGILRKTGQVLRDQEQALTDELEQVRKQGYAVMSEVYSEREYDNNLWAMAVPIRDQHKVYASLNIMMLKQAISQEMALERYLDPLQNAAADIAATLAGHNL